jgi:hypothetical protein
MFNTLPAEASPRDQADLLRLAGGSNTLLRLLRLLGLLRLLQSTAGLQADHKPANERHD